MSATNETPKSTSRKTHIFGALVFEELGIAAPKQGQYYITSDGTLGYAASTYFVWKSMILRPIAIRAYRSNNEYLGVRA